MINIYSPTIQQIRGTPPGSLPTQADFMNPPVQYGQGDFSPALQTIPPQQMAYNYGPAMGQPMPYQQQRDFAAQQLQQELYNPMTPTVQVGGYGGVPQYQYNQYWPNQQCYGGNIFQQQQEQQQNVVQGFNPLGVDTMQSVDYDQRKQEIEEFYQDAARQDQNANGYSPYHNAYDYYGGMNNCFIDSTIVNAYVNAKHSLENEAKENRIEMNKALSRIAHSYSGEEITEDELADIYDDKIMPTPAGYNSYDQAQAVQLSNVKPYHDNYRESADKADAAVSAKYHSFTSEDSNMYEFFDNAGMILWDQWNQEGIRRQRDRTRFGDGEFKQFLHTQMERREPNNVNALKALAETFPDGINEIVSGGMPDGMDILDDNTVQINYPVKKEVVNECEDEHKRNQYAFMNAIYNKRG